MVLKVSVCLLYFADIQAFRYEILSYRYFTIRRSIKNISSFNVLFIYLFVILTVIVCNCNKVFNEFNDIVCSNDVIKFSTLKVRLLYQMSMHNF